MSRKHLDFFLFFIFFLVFCEFITAYPPALYPSYTRHKLLIINTNITITPPVIISGGGGGCNLEIIIPKNFFVTKLDVSLNNNQYCPKIQVSSFNQSATEEIIIFPKATIYDVFTIEKNFNESMIVSAKLTFKVSKRWLQGNKIDMRDIILFHYMAENTGWIEEPVIISDEDNDYYYYESEFNSFSYFIVGIEKPDYTKYLVGVILLLVVLLVYYRHKYLQKAQKKRKV